jgi:signal transduction histidine kinase
MWGMTGPTHPNPEDTKAEISCRAAKGIILYLRRERGPQVLEEVFTKAGVPVEYVNEGSNWMSFAAFNRLLDAMVAVTGDPDSPYQAGTHTSDPSTFGPVRVMGQRFLSIQGVYRMMTMHSRYFVKICDWTLLGYSQGHVRIQIRYHKGYAQTRWNCDNIRGHLSSIPTWLNHTPAQVTHHTCILHGAEVCIYDVDWIEEPSQSVAVLGGIGGILLGVTGFAVPASLRVSQGLWIVLTASLGVAIAGVFALHGRLRSVRRQHLQESDSLMKVTEVNQTMYSELQSKVEERTKELREALAELEASRAEALVRERDAAIGVLASGMAHDMNSPLNAITLTLQALDEDLPPDSPSRPLLPSAKRATQRCKRLVADLLAFSREPRMADAASLEEVVRRCLELFGTDSPPTIHTALEVIGEPVQLKFDKAQLQQAILNLLENAADAMGGKGNIRLRLRTSGGEVVLEVEDDGPGMSTEVQSQVFEPFFTTKKTGHGLGLAITRRLVSRNGGQVELESALGAGTTFRLRFPFPKAMEPVTKREGT